jgi:nitrite reductase/ring-hydroxylating ferredoxin subunit
MTTMESDTSKALPVGTGEPPAENPWRALGVNLEKAKFPARASFEGQGIVVFKTSTGYRGVQRNCPHMQATMLQAVVTPDETMVRCFLHAFTFRLSNGKGVNCPGYRVQVYEVKEENGVLYGRVAT